MKTTVTVTRTMGDFIVEQRTSDGKFNATNLAKQWNNSIGVSMEKGKRPKDFLSLDATKEFIQALLQDDCDNFKGEINTPFEVPEDKVLNPYYIVTKGKYGGTWMSPLLFLDFAMWLNPTFKVKVLRFVYDNLIELRHEAGDKYSPMTSAIKDKIVPKLSSMGAKFIYSNVAKLVNKKIFGEHDKMIRNRATLEQSKALIDLEAELATLIKVNHLKSYEDIKTYLQL